MKLTQCTAKKAASYSSKEDRRDPIPAHHIKQFTWDFLKNSHKTEHLKPYQNNNDEIQQPREQDYQTRRMEINTNLKEGGIHRAETQSSNQTNMLVHIKMKQQREDCRLEQ
eukprot:gene6502-311_t